MTQLLTEAFEKAGKLSEQEQNLLANWILAEMASELRWTKAFADSEDKLAQLADEALAEHRAGRTKALDPESL
ncbi:MAG: hypothetical protein ACE5IR_23820 [bacterium]